MNFVETRTETTSGGTLHSQPAFMPIAVQPQAAIDGIILEQLDFSLLYQ